MDVFTVNKSKYSDLTVFLSPTLFVTDFTAKQTSIDHHHHGDDQSINMCAPIFFAAVFNPERTKKN